MMDACLNIKIIISLQGTGDNLQIWALAQEILINAIWHESHNCRCITGMLQDFITALGNALLISY